MGKDAHLEHDLRYEPRRMNSWKWCSATGDSWEDGSLLIDKEERPLCRSGQGQAYRPQGAILQVAAGPVHGAAFAGRGHPRHYPGRRQRPRPAFLPGDGAKSSSPRRANLAGAKQGYDAIRNEAAKAGRDPDQMFLCNLVTPVAGRDQGPRPKTRWR